MRPLRGTRRFVLALALVVAITAVDASLGGTAVVIDLLVAPPLVAATAAGPWRTALVGALCIGAAIPLGLVGDGFFDSNHAVAVATVALGAALGVWISALRDRRERDALRLRVQYGVARALAEAESLEDAAPELLAAVGDALGWEVGGFWRAESAEAVRCIATWSAPGADAADFRRASEDLELARGQGLPGRVLERGEPITVADVLTEPNFPRAPYAERADLHGAVAVPIRVEGAVAAVIEFFGRRRRSRAEVADVLSELQGQVGEFLEARASEDALRHERRRVQEERERRLQLEQVARLGAMQAREQLEAILAGVADGVTAQAPDGSLLFANAAAVRTLGFESAAELLAAPVAEVVGRFEVFDEAGRPYPLEHLPGRLALQGEPAEALLRFRIRATGEERWSLVKANPVFDDAGSVAMAINVMEDITETKRSELREQFLSEASRVLASSLDSRRTLRQMAQLAVPEIADWCAVDLVATDGSMDRVALEHADPAQVERAERLRKRYPPRAEDGAARVIRTQQSELYPEIPDELIEQAAQDEEHLELIRDFGLTSAMVVPILGHDRACGAITFVSGASGRRFDDHDLALADELARRCASALENARLFDERDYIAQTLQRSLLPTELPHIPGLETAARFRASGEGHEVGGDFYDVFQTGERTWALVVGDVCGKGPDAAAVTALARYTLRAAAMRESAPSRILALLNEALLRQRSDRRFCTVAFTRLDAGGDGVTICGASGGHPLPLLLRADGTVTPFGRPGTLLGVVDDPDLHDSAESLGPGDVLVFYTDGVTEARDGDKPLGEERLVELLRECAGQSADSVAGRVEAAALEVQGDAIRDDIAVVALRTGLVSPELGNVDPKRSLGTQPISAPDDVERESEIVTSLRTSRNEVARGRQVQSQPRAHPGGGPRESLTLELEGGPQAAATARAELRRLTAHLDPRTVETLRLLVTELVANSVRHARAAAVGLKAMLAGQSVWVEVTDRGPGFDPDEEQRQASNRLESGWGLLLVDELSDRWGVEQEAGVNRVWFELKR